MYFPTEISVILQFLFASLLPVAASASLAYLIHHTKLGEAGYWRWQISCGLIFGIIAIFGTEMGINTTGATMNVRDAAPIVAGLYFGGPAGIIAGIIGGVERWLSVLWGRGMFTRVACSVATAAAGLYAAIVSRYILDERRPRWTIAAAAALVIEVLHLLLVFLTNLDQMMQAFTVVRLCTAPMISFNCLSVALSGFAVEYVASGGSRIRREAQSHDISQIIQVGMLFVVAVSYVLTTLFMGSMQHGLSLAEARDLMRTTVADVYEDINTTSDELLESKARQVASAIPFVNAATDEVIASLCAELEVSEIHVIDASGIIVASSHEQYVGFDMHSGEQSSEFLDLLPGGSATYIVQPFQPMTMDASQWRKYAGRRISDGFVQVGYDQDRFVTDIIERMQQVVTSRHVGHSGRLVVLTPDEALAGTYADEKLSDEVVGQLADAVRDAADDTLFELSFAGEPCYALCQSAEGFRIIALEPREEVDLSRDLSMLVISFAEVCVFAALFIAIYLLIKRVVVDSILRVNGRLGQITGGDLVVQVDVRDSTEFSSLSDGINDTVAALRHAIEAEAARIDRELSYAREIQQSALQQVFPPYPDHHEFELFASMRAAKEVGGDFYDFYLLDSTHLAFLIADVSGKGIPAALFMMRAKTAIKSLVSAGSDVNDVFTQANNQLCEGNDADMFVTAWMGVIDLESGHVRFANAGHNPPALRRADGSFALLDMRKNLVLACMEGIRYRINELDLAPGDVLYLYTDGIVEAIDETEEQYGNERLLATLDRHASESVEELCRAVVADVDAFAGEAPQFDDMTMLALRYLGAREEADTEER